MGEYRMDPKKQFSKALARWTAIFWFLYMTWLSVVMLMQPGTSLYCVYMGLLVSGVMVLNVYSYTKNSIAEKLVLAMLDKTRIEIGLKNGSMSGTTSEGSEDDPDEAPAEEGDMCG